MSKLLFGRFALACTLLTFAFGCKTSRHLSYFQDLTDTARVQTVDQYPYKPVKLQVNDELQILVTSSSPEASQPFNIISSGLSSASAVLNSYRVTPSGFITMPILGDVQVLGLTTLEVKQKVRDLLEPYLKDAVVSVTLLNFKVTVIGEVARPVVVPVNGERINVVEAIGAAGDMTVFSKRFNVKILRTGPNGLEVAHLNFNTSKMLQSPYYQLQQNDIVYIEPESAKGIAGERTTVLLPILVSLTTLTLTLVNLFLR